VCHGVQRSIPIERQHLAEIDRIAMTKQQRAGSCAALAVVIHKGSHDLIAFGIANRLAFDHTHFTLQYFLASTAAPGKHL
jgi:peptidoglycan hydrolase-like amidase